MEATFNLGIGMIAVVSAESADAALGLLAERGVDAWVGRERVRRQRRTAARPAWWAARLGDRYSAEGAQRDGRGSSSRSSSSGSSS